MAPEPDLARSFGVPLRKNLCCFPIIIETYDVEYERVKALEKASILGFDHNAKLIREYKNSGLGAVDAFQDMSPVIGPDQAMSFLMKMVKNEGGRLIPGIVLGDVWECGDEILREYNVDIIVNTSGLSSRELASDQNMHAGRAGLLCVVNDGSRFPKIEPAMIANNQDPENYNII